MPNLQIKLYHRYICIGKNLVPIGFGIVHSFRHPLEVLDLTTVDKGGQPYSQKGHKLPLCCRLRTCKKGEIMAPTSWACQELLYPGAHEAFRMVSGLQEASQRIKLYYLHLLPIHFLFLSLTFSSSSPVISSPPVPCLSAEGLLGTTGTRP